MDREAILRAHESVDYAVLQIPAYADFFVAKAIGHATLAMELHRVKGAIVKMANPTPESVVPDSGFSANAIVLERLRASAVPLSVVEPIMYLDTSLKPNFRHEISVDQLIDLPLAHNVEVAWTTADDAARMAAGLLTAKLYGSTVRCAGDIAVHGHQLAAAFSSVLDRKIKYRSTPMDVFQREIETALGPAASALVVAKFRFLSQYREEACRLLGGTFKAVDILPDFEPTKIENWVQANRRNFEITAS